MFFLSKSPIDLPIVVNSLSMRAFRFSTSMFTCPIKSFLISFKTISEILFVFLVDVFGVPRRGVGEISSSTNSLFSQSNFEFSSIRFFVRRTQRVSCIVVSSQFVAEDLFI